MAPSAGRRANGGKPCDARADHQHLGRRHLAGGGDLAGEEAAEIVASLDHRAVAGDVGHRRQRIHLLGARDARHHVHGDDGGALLSPAPADRVLGRPEERDQGLALAQKADSSSVGGRTFITSAASKAAASGTMLPRPRHRPRPRSPPLPAPASTKHACPSFCSRQRSQASSQPGSRPQISLSVSQSSLSNFLIEVTRI